MYLRFLPTLLAATLLPAASAQTIQAVHRHSNPTQAGLGQPAPRRAYVDSQATGMETGTSWTNAYTSLQSALTATQVGEIWVAAGTYYPGAAGEQAATFQLKNHVRLYGGFAGHETQLQERDVALNTTILSADIDQNDTYGTGNNWWQFGWSGNFGNCFHIVTGSGTDSTAVLDGFMMVGGRPDDLAQLGGGGLLVLNGAPAIRNCTFRYCAAGFGSSAYLANCQSVFENCDISDGYTCFCGYGGWASGVMVAGTSFVAFVDCEFRNHYYVSSTYQGRGAALSTETDSTVSLVGCRFLGNQTGNLYPVGGGIAYGGAVFAMGDLFVDRSVFLDNFAHAGAGIAAWRNLSVTNSLFARNRVVSHPNTSGFNDGGYSAGLITLGSGGFNVDITNCTFVDNNAAKGGAFGISGGSTAHVANTIAYHNYADPVAPGEDEVWILKQQITGTYSLRNSCVEGLLQTEPGENPPNPANFPGCIDSMPQLLDRFGPDGWAHSGDEDYHLGANSPCIDAGHNPSLPGSFLVDLDGQARFQDDPTTVDTGTGPAPVVDMGAYER